MNLDDYDAVSEILLRLPVRSILRFSCVCKDWCALVKSPLFKDTYLALRRNRAVDDEVVGLKRLFNHSGFYKSYLTCYGDYEPFFAISASSIPPSNDYYEIPGNRTGFMIIINHVNGIVCIHGKYSGDLGWENAEKYWFDIIIVNPSLREVRNLPIPDFERLGITLRSEGSELTVDNVGFGYDEATNDYKVLAIITVVELDYKQIGFVYYLSTNSWRMLGDMSLFISHDYLCMNHESIFSYGSIHWIIRHDPNYRILIFNMTNELFQEMLFPHAWRYYDHDKIIPHLLTIDKSTVALAAFRNESLDSNVAQVLDIWVMKEYGDSESWTKQYSISSLPRFHKPLSFWKKDKLLLMTRDYQLICCDLLKGQVYEYGEYNPFISPNNLFDGHVFEYGQQFDPNSDEPMGWDLDFVTGHESFVSVKLV